MSDGTYPESKLWDIIADIRTTMLVTLEEGRIVSRPMSAYVDRDERCIWFITETDSDKTRAIGDGDNVNLAFADIDDSTYVSLNGSARVTRDIAKQKQLWNAFAEAWLPEGPEAPNVGLIRIDPIDAVYWDSPSSKVVQLWQVAKGNVTQTPPSGSDTGKVRFA